MVEHMIRRSLPAAIGAALLCTSAAPAPAAESPAAFAGMAGIVFRYYDVAGADERQIYAALQQRAPRRPDGSVAIGLTAWALDYRWDQLTDRRGCRARDPGADLRIIVTLPRLIDVDRLSPRARAWWTGYQHTIERHEAGHVRIALDHRDDFARAAEGSRCGDTKAIGEQIVQRIAALQEAYDRLTRHGRDQDAAD